jgi:hypothetical protein
MGKHATQTVAKGAMQSHTQGTGHPLTKVEKIGLAAGLAEKSAAAAEFFKFGKAEWAEFLSLWDEEGIDDFLLILNEEKSMLEDIEKTAARKKQVNKTRLEQRFEKIRTEAEQLTTGKNG